MIKNKSARKESRTYMDPVSTPRVYYLNEKSLCPEHPGSKEKPNILNHISEIQYGINQNVSLYLKK